jgi:hypothetical protein
MKAIINTLIDVGEKSITQMAVTMFSIAASYIQTMTKSISFIVNADMSVHFMFDLLAGHTLSQVWQAHYLHPSLYETIYKTIFITLLDKLRCSTQMV